MSDATDYMPKLAEAVQSRSLIRITRETTDGSQLTGVAVDFVEDWILLCDTTDYHLDGYAAIRADDACGLDIFPPGSFRTRVFDHYREKPALPRSLDTTSIPGLIRSACERFGMISVRTEKIDGDWYIGNVNSVDIATLSIRLIDSEANWQDRETVLSLNDITMIQFASRYERALSEVGGPPTPIIL